ncbi:MAG TPA: AbrB/MazE/SpoVT family DNA-binding domain-containing protein [Thermomicrobiales bacterium]|nr:AbrB/MazE/SpoVT family DNA-binding domain-containing protein [Thermomicrobiales bacterium]
MTIPAEIRRELGIEPETMLAITVEGNELRIKPLHLTERTEGSSWFRELYELFAPVRQEAIDKGYTDEEINAWIDEALHASRAERD